MLSTCCPVRLVRSTLGQQQQNLGLGLTIIMPVLERIQGFLLRVETRMILYIDIFLARDTMVLIEDISIRLIDRVSGEESALRDKEGQWAYRLNCIQLQGLNISDFFAARIGRLGLVSGKSARVFTFLCSTCKFSNLFLIM